MLGIGPYGTLVHIGQEACLSWVLYVNGKGMAPVRLEVAIADMSSLSYPCPLGLHPPQSSHCLNLLSLMEALKLFFSQ